MDIKRLLRHLFMTHWRVRHAFPAAAVQAIEQSIRQAEQTHGGEIKFAVEGELHPIALWRNVSARARAQQLFGTLGVWDTADNNGVLIYLLFADRAVEIVADRGLQNKVSAAEWSDICRSMQIEFSAGNFERGVVTGIAAVSALLARHFPVRDANELPDSVAMI